MYLECLSCPKLGATCKGPNFISMPSHDLWVWCKKRKNQLHMTNAELAELSGTPKGTIDRLFAKDQADFRFETIRSVVCVLVGGEVDDDCCPNQQDHRTNGHETETISNLKEEVDFLKVEIKSKRTAVITLGIALAIALLSVIVALVIDKLNPDIGFFWHTAEEANAGDEAHTVEDVLHRINNWRIRKW